MSNDVDEQPDIYECFAKYHPDKRVKAEIDGVGCNGLDLHYDVCIQDEKRSRTGRKLFAICELDEYKGKSYKYDRTPSSLAYLIAQCEQRTETHINLANRHRECDAWETTLPHTVAWQDKDDIVKHIVRLITTKQRRKRAYPAPFYPLRLHVRGHYNPECQSNFASSASDEREGSTSAFVHYETF